ncbi:hypothetical protein VCHC56A2_3809, partial [Vibrio cholerae HC-56A2]
MAGLFRLCLG